MSKYTNHPTHILTSLATYVHSEAQSVSLSQTSITRVLERFLFTLAAMYIQAPDFTSKIAALHTLCLSRVEW